MRVRRHRPLFLIDIAVPRDCEPEINKIDGAYLYDIDDLQEIVDRNRGAREREAEEAEDIVEEEVAKVEAWLAGLEVVPTINLLRGEVEKIRQAEFERIARRMGDVDEETLRKVEMLSTCLVNKILHQPTVRLKELAATDHDATLYIEAVRHLFGLEELPEDGRQGTRARPPRQVWGGRGRGRRGRRVDRGRADRRTTPRRRRAERRRAEQPMSRATMSWPVRPRLDGRSQGAA